MVKTENTISISFHVERRLTWQTVIFTLIADVVWGDFSTTELAPMNKVSIFSCRRVREDTENIIFKKIDAY